MNIEAVVLLEGDLDAQRLVVTWAQVANQYEQDPDAARERWASISGVYVEDVQRLEPMLFGNDIIASGGMVDDNAMMFIRGRIVTSMPKPTRQR